MEWIVGVLLLLFYFLVIYEAYSLGYKEGRTDTVEEVWLSMYRRAKYANARTHYMDDTELSIFLVWMKDGNYEPKEKDSI